MPYQAVGELPEAVREHLPAPAQAIYLAAYNSAWEQYDQPEERRNDASREETAHRVAGAAVKQKYQKDEQGRWVKAQAA